MLRDIAGTFRSMVGENPSHRPIWVGRKPSDLQQPVLVILRRLNDMELISAAESIQFSFWAAGKLLRRAHQQLKAVDSAVQEVLEVLQPGPSKVFCVTVQACFCRSMNHVGSAQRVMFLLQ